jgi:hypothetical protein
LLPTSSTANVQLPNWLPKPVAATATFVAGS